MAFHEVSVVLNEHRLEDLCADIADCDPRVTWEAVRQLSHDTFIVRFSGPYQSINKIKDYCGSM